MQKLLLIVQREYFTRVSSRSFILTTLLAPLGIALFGVVASLIFSYQSDNLNVVIRDDAHLLDSSFQSKPDKGLIFTIDNAAEPLDTLVAHQAERHIDGVLYLPPMPDLNQITGIAYYSDKAMGLFTQDYIERELATRIRDRKVAASGYNRTILDGFKTEVKIEQRTAESNEDKTVKQGIAYVIGGAMGFIIYIILLVYGTMVMRSVVEEKTSRIVEVMISSVKPFQLMLGKMIGVGLVGLTQLTIWFTLSLIFQLIITLVLGAHATEHNPMAAAQTLQQTGMNAHELNDMLQVVLKNLAAQNWLLIIPLFVFYFIGGYFLYAAMFAAVGSAAGDDISESQSLTLPITIPVVLAIYIMFAVIQNPNSSLARWSSMVPLFSPIVMPARLPFGPAWWEIALSVGILAVTSMGAVWLAGRIYRVGILLYGKKASFREIAKWMFTNE